MSIPLKPDAALLILRLAFGGMMAISHGLGKVERLFSSGPIQFADPVGVGAPISLIVATFAEFLCAVLVALGIFTRAACIPVIIVMATAAFIVHAADPLAKKELALLYLAAYTAILFLGPGRYALERYLPRR